VMTPKERVLEAINFREPDTVPIFITVTPQVAEKLKEESMLTSGKSKTGR